MVKHVILWNIDDKYSAEEKKDIKNNIKINLESLLGKISGLKEIKVITSGLSSSTADLMLDSLFEDKEALKEYAQNPIHNSVADTYVRPYTVKRSCLDFEI